MIPELQESLDKPLVTQGTESQASGVTATSSSPGNGSFALWRLAQVLSTQLLQGKGDRHGDAQL